MGYRNYLNIVSKKDFKKVDEDFINKLKDEDGYVYIGDVLKAIGAKEIFELGKYSEEGYALECKPIKVRGYIKKSYDILKQYAKEHGYGFNIVTVDSLIEIIEKYHERTVQYWHKLLSDAPMESGQFGCTIKPEEKCMYYVQNLLNWEEFMTNINMNSLYSVQTSWKYEYEIYNLLHILKMVDWDKNLLIVTGH